MLEVLARIAAVAFALAPFAASAEPVKLKLSMFTSDRSAAHQIGIKPFVDAVNAAGKGVLQIDVSFSGALGGTLAQQPQLVLDGVADMALIVPGLSPDRFPDNTVMELPGLFRDVREATLAHSALVAKNALRGYDDFVVIGAFGSEPETIHARKRVAAIGDLEGLKLRANNATETVTLQRLGAIPVVLAINQTADAISRGSIDGALGPPVMLFEFGISRVTSYHYLLGTSVAPLALVMNRARFDSLPEQAKAIIKKYSGDWIAQRYFEQYIIDSKQAVERLLSEPRRHVVVPTPADQEAAQQAFKDVVDEWAATSARHRQLLSLVRGELAQIRSVQ